MQVKNMNIEKEKEINEEKMNNINWLKKTEESMKTLKATISYL